MIEIIWNGIVDKDSRKDGRVYVTHENHQELWPAYEFLKKDCMEYLKCRSWLNKDGSIFCAYPFTPLIFSSNIKFTRKNNNEKKKDNN